MPKMKSRKALTKRVKVTGTGKLKRKCAYTGHLAPHKTHKQKRHLRKGGLVHPTDQQRLMSQIQK